MKNFIVKDCVCDYGVYLEQENCEDELLLILNSEDNADLICEILRDDNHNEFGISAPISYKEKLERDFEWYKMWHRKFKIEIEKLKKELETYRPTKLIGNGFCTCDKCKEEGRQSYIWTDWCSRYKGHIYCDSCLKEILEEEGKKNEK